MRVCSSSIDRANRLDKENTPVSARLEKRNLIEEEVDYPSGFNTKTSSKEESCIVRVYFFLVPVCVPLLAPSSSFTVFTTVPGLFFSPRGLLFSIPPPHPPSFSSASWLPPLLSCNFLPPPPFISSFTSPVHYYHHHHGCPPYFRRPSNPSQIPSFSHHFNGITVVPSERKRASSNANRLPTFFVEVLTEEGRVVIEVNLPCCVVFVGQMICDCSFFQSIILAPLPHRRIRKVSCKEGRARQAKRSSRICIQYTCIVRTGWGGSHHMEGRS